MAPTYSAHRNFNNMSINAEIPLGIKTPAPIDPLEAYGRILGIQGKQQEIQNQQDQHQANTAIASENFKKLQQQNAEAQQDARDQEITRKAYVDASGKPDDTIKVMAQAGASAKALEGAQTHFATLAEHTAKTAADQLKIDADKNDKFLALHDTALGLDDQQLAQAWPQIYAQIATLDPNAAKSLNPQQPPSKSDILVSRASHQTLGYNLAAETEKRAAAEAADKAAAAARDAAKGPAELTKAQNEAAASALNAAGLTANQQREADQAAATAANAAQTATQKDYAAAQSQGFKGTLLDYEKTRAAAGRAPDNGIAAQNALDREATRFAKPHEKAVADANGQLEKISDARAMINGSAEAQALGLPKVLTALVGGQGSGVRITKPELQAIATARGVVGDVEGFLNSVSGNGKLTATQKQQLTQMLDDVKGRLEQKRDLANDTLTKINSAGSREEIVQHDTNARQRIADMEKGGSGTKKISTKAEYDALPKGTAYIDPNGTPGIKR